VLVVDSVDQDHDVAPGQFCSVVLQNRVRPGRGEAAHVGEVPGSQTPHPGELCLQVVGESLNGPAAPLVVALTIQQELPDPPVELDDLRVDRAGGSGPARADLGLDLRQQLALTRRDW
jgi:hypothetical protein